MSRRTWSVGYPGFYGHRAIRQSSDGEMYTTLEPAVPIIPDIFVNSVIYLYPTVDDAEHGTRYGGSGCLISVPTTNEDLPKPSHHVYAVSNVHVVRDLDSPAPVIRFNRPVDGGPAVLQLAPDDWLPSPTGDDVAAYELNIDFTAIHAAGLGMNTFITPERIDGIQYGLGGECFLIGRYLGVDGRDRGNRPVVRFGNLSRDTTEMLKREDGSLQESYLVEMRSLSGFSGSPCWIWDDGFELYGKAQEREDKFLMAGRQPALLGIDWCHLPWESQVLDDTLEDGGQPTGDWSIQNSGMAGIVPAWKIRELLEDDELKDKREEDERNVAKRARPARGISDAATQKDAAYKRSDFEHDLRKVSKPEARPEREA